jgi:hypothetical protein
VFTHLFFQSQILYEWNQKSFASAGDLYAFPTAHSIEFGALVADVNGHGVPAALIASIYNSKSRFQRERRRTRARLYDHGIEHGKVKLQQSRTKQIAALIFRCYSSSNSATTVWAPVI